MINHVTQGKNECVFACIAMVTDVPVEEVKQLLPNWDGEGVSLQEELDILRKLGCVAVRYVDAELVHNRVYILTVPTKSKAKTSHRIVLDLGYFSPETILYDPNTGRELEENCYKEFADLPAWWDVVEIPYNLGNQWKRIDGVSNNNNK